MTLVVVLFLIKTILMDTALVIVLFLIKTILMDTALVVAPTESVKLVVEIVSLIPLIFSIFAF